jgi:hypothetical protein
MKKLFGFGCAGMLLLMAAFCGLGALVAPVQSKPGTLTGANAHVTPEKPKTRDELIAYFGDSSHGTAIKRKAKQDILSQLKYPDDASFPWTGIDASYSVTPNGTPCWRVWGKVQTKNGFGAELTQRFEMVYAVDLEKQNIWLRYLTLGGQTFNSQRWKKELEE